MLVLKRTHPCARPLGGARKIIGQEDGDPLAVRIHNLEDPYVGVIGRNSVMGTKGEAEQPFGGVKRGLDHLFELQIGFYLRFF